MDDDFFLPDDILAAMVDSYSAAAEPDVSKDASVQHQSGEATILRQRLQALEAELHHERQRTNELDARVKSARGEEEAKYKANLERLRTDLAFKDHEAQVAAREKATLQGQLNELQLRMLQDATPAAGVDHPLPAAAAAAQRRMSGAAPAAASAAVNNNNGGRPLPQAALPARGAGASPLFHKRAMRPSPSSSLRKRPALGAPAATPLRSAAVPPPPPRAEAFVPAMMNTAQKAPPSYPPPHAGWHAPPPPSYPPHAGWSHAEPPPYPPPHAGWQQHAEPPHAHHAGWQHAEAAPLRAAHLPLAHADPSFPAADPPPLAPMATPVRPPRAEAMMDAAAAAGEEVAMEEVVVAMGSAEPKARPSSAAVVPFAAPPVAQGPLLLSRLLAWPASSLRRLLLDASPDAAGADAAPINNKPPALKPTAVEQDLLDRRRVAPRLLSVMPLLACSRDGTRAALLLRELLPHLRLPPSSSGQAAGDPS